MLDLIQRLVTVEREIQASQSARAAERRFGGPQRSASIGMSFEKEISPCVFLGARTLVAARPDGRRRVLHAVLTLLFVLTSGAFAEAQFYAGAMGGISTLSGDTRVVINPGSTSFSTYNPQNGLLLNGLLGKHLTDFVSVQGDYVWNRNLLNLTRGVFSSGSVAEYEEARRSSQESLFASALVYFRKRRSRIRPYLSVGTGWVHLASTEQSTTNVHGAAVLPPNQFSANMIALRVPVGIDVTLHNAWRFRYSFTEVISHNPISNELSPPGPHSLKNFQNLFGIVRQF